jgi:DNA modification methylase
MARHLIIRGNCNRLPIPDNSIDCCVTSPPYFGLRHYSEVASSGELGREDLINDYIVNLVCALREVRRVLKNDGTLWLNLGDRFATARLARLNNIRPKERTLIPQRAAIALQTDGWRVRSDIVWSKPNATPESVRDRPTASHEYIFLLTKSDNYYYNEMAVRELSICKHPSGNGFKREARLSYRDDNGARGNDKKWIPTSQRRCRSVWSINTKSYRTGHAGTFPPDLARRCIRASCPPDGIVLDPFAGSYTVAEVAQEEGFDSVGVELYQTYCTMGRERILITKP